MATSRIRELRLKEIYPEPERAKVIGGGRLEDPFASLEDVDQVIHGPCRIYDPSGKVQLIAIPIGNVKRFHELLPKVPYSRAARSQGIMSRSKTFGYAPRLPVHKHEACRRAALYNDDRAASDLLFEAAPGVEKIYARELPEEFKAHKEEVEQRVLPAWRINDTVFTSGIINRDNAMHYHIDRGNFKERWSAMLVFRNHCQGGELVIPEWRIAHACNDGLLMIFHGQKWWHGVAPIKLLRKSSYRITVVYYSLNSMWQCLEPTKELERARKVRTEREQKKERVSERKQNKPTPREPETIVLDKSKPRRRARKSS